MKKSVQVCGIALLVVALCAMTAAASSISVNSTCVVGTCSSSDVLAIGASSSNPFSLTYSFANTDRYLLTGVLSTENSASSFRLSVTDLLVTYQGNRSGTVSDNDVLQTDFLQNVANRTTYVASYYESVDGTFGPGLANASSATAQAFFAGQGVQVLGPYYATGAPSFSGYASGTTRMPAGAPLLDYRYTLTFGEGSRPGASISINPTAIAPAPEPGSLALMSTGAVGMLAAWRRRHLTATA